MATTRTRMLFWLIFTVPIALIIGTALFVRFYFTSDRLKDMVLPPLQEAVNRPVDVKGISLSLFPTLAVQVENLTVANASGPGFSAQPLFSTDRLILNLRLWPLFQRKLEIGTVVLEQPRLLIESAPDGKTNYADLGGGAVDTTEPAEPLAGGGFVLSNLTVTNGTIEVLNRETNSATAMRGVHLTAQASLQPDSSLAEAEIQASVYSLSYGSLTSMLLANLRATVDGRLLYRIDRDSLAIVNGTLTLQDLILRTSGYVRSASKTPYLNLTLRSDSLSIPELLSLVPQEYMNRAEGLRSTGTARASMLIRGEMSDSSQIEVSGSINARGATIQYPQIPKPITNVAIVATFARTAARQELSVEQFSATLGENPISATALVQGFDDPTLSLAIKAALNLAEVKDYYPLEAGTDMRGNLGADVRVAGKASAPASMKATGSITLQGVTVTNPAAARPVEGLQGTISFNNDRVESKQLSMKLGRSDLSLGFQLNNYLPLVTGTKGGPRPTAIIRLNSNHLYTADLTGDAEKAGKTATTPQDEKKGALPLPDVAMDVAATIGTLTMERFEFSAVRARVRIADGIVTIQDLSLNTFGGAVSSRGTINLQKPDRPTFDLATDMKKLQAGPMLTQFTSFGQRVGGTMSMNTTMKGALDDTLGLIPAALSGDGEVRIENGTATGIAVNKAVAGFLNLPDLETITFKDWSQAFTVADGRMAVRDLKISALQADYVVNGTVGLDGTLDYRMSLILPEKTSSRIAIPGFAGPAVDFFKNEQGRVKLDFAVSGTSDSPKISLKTDDAQKKAEDFAKGKLDEQTKKLQDQLKKGAKDALDKLFGPKKP